MIRIKLTCGLATRWTSFILAAAATVSFSTPVHAQAQSNWIGHSVGCGEGCTDGCTDPLLAPPPNEPIYNPSDTPIQDSPALSQTPSTTPNIFQGGVEGTLPPQSQAPASIFSGGVEGTLVAQSHAPGYIDNAIPQSQFRLRFDAGFDNVTPDRAEFFYAQCGCSGGPGPGNDNVVNGSVDYQEIRAYMEIAASNRFSVFGTVPVRFIQGVGPADNRAAGVGDAGGLGDIEVGFKYALSTDPRNFLTFQLRGYLPTGDADRGLGTQNVNIEPALLWQSRVSDRVTVFGELRDWIPIQGSKFQGEDFAGNIIRYGLGVGVTAHENCSVRISPIAEVVGWSVLDGLVNDAELTGAGNIMNPDDAQTTIVNAKIGLRTFFKRDNSALYVGYGRSLTGTRWYQDIVRVDYTMYY